MQEQDAIAAAWDYVKQEQFAVSKFHSAQHFPASALPTTVPKRNDHWVVRFELTDEADVVDSPDLLLIEVDDVTGEVSAFESL